MCRPLFCAALVTCSCLGDCLDPGSGGTGGGGSGGGGENRTLRYHLVEAQGQISVKGTYTTGQCARQTTSSVVRFSMPASGSGVSTYSTSRGSLTASADIQLTVEPRVGMESCGASMSACPSYADTVQSYEGFLLVTQVDPQVASGQPAAKVLAPVLQLRLPELCANGDDYVPPVAVQRARPISVDQLLTGRFVLESEGTSALQLPTPDQGLSDDALDGQLQWSWRFVFQTDDYDPGTVDPGAPTLPLFDTCAIDDEPTEASIDQASSQFAAGGTDLALNPSGCRRLLVTRTGNDVKLEQTVSRGTRFTVDATGAVSAAPDAHTSYVREVVAGAVRDRSDLDGDGFFEATNEWSFDGAGALTRVVGEELDPVSHQVASRATLTPSGANVHVVLERRVGGALAVEREFDTGRTQHSCFNGNGGGAGGGGGGSGGSGGAGGGAACGGSVRACTQQERSSILRRLARVTGRGTACIAETGFKSFDYEGKGLSLIASSQLSLKCDTNPCGPYGSMSDADRSGVHELTVNVAKGSSAAASRELDSTLFHELLHADARFRHDDALDNAAYQAGKLTIADRTYACEAMCFSPSKIDACTCIRCLDPQVSEVLNTDICKECTDKYGSTDACAKRYVGGKAVASAVGAWCKGNQVFCDTKAECDSQCSSGCMPIRATCDPTCN